MKRLISSAACAALGLVTLAGCASNCASSGWEFRCGRPATFYTPGLVQQNPGPLQVAPLGSTVPPMISGVTAQAGPVHLVSPERAPAPRMGMTPPAATEDCTCEMLLQSLRRIEARLSALSVNRPLPKGPEEE